MGQEFLNLIIPDLNKYMDHAVTEGFTELVAVRNHTIRGHKTIAKGTVVLLLELPALNSRRGFITVRDGDEVLIVNSKHYTMKVENVIGDLVTIDESIFTYTIKGWMPVTNGKVRST